MLLCNCLKTELSDLTLEQKGEELDKLRWLIQVKDTQNSDKVCKANSIGGVMVQRACSNGHAICKDLGYVPLMINEVFFPVTKFLHSKIKPQH